MEGHPGRMRVAYFGPEGTFTQEALLSATAGQSFEPQSFDPFRTRRSTTR